MAANASEILKRQNALRERVERELENFRYLEERLADPEVGGNPALLKEVSSEHSRLNANVDEFKTYLKDFESLQEAYKILEDNSADNELKEFAREEKTELEESLVKAGERIEILLLPPDPHDGKPILMEIRAGTGGDEAALFVGDLFQMYLRYAEKQGLKMEVIEANDTELGGYKEVVFSVQGTKAYAALHQEGGAHRVQRIPTTESGGRIHTSAVTVAVMPEVEEAEVEIDDKDLKIDTFRASGAGGQHVNKTDSAIRILHIPTGIVVSCQDERSQLKNKIKAMRVLRARLAEKQEREKHAQESALKKEQVGSGDRSERIRTYNFPQGRVTDHRVGYTSYNLSGFMEGDMGELLEVLLKAEREVKLQAQQT